MADLDALYIDDFDAWCELQIEAPEKHQASLPADIDGPHIAEELRLMLHRERRMAEA